MTVGLDRRQVEWRTVALIGACYACFGAATTWLAVLPVAAICLAALAIAFFSSLQHEVIHGHPTPWTPLNEAFVFPALTLVIPYLRFRDTHLDHHRDANLTDPYDDPESNFLDPRVWDRLPWAMRVLLGFNNTLLGRLTVGVLVGQVTFLAGDLRAIRAGDARVIRGWLWHLPALALIGAWFALVAAMPVWQYLIAVYGGLSLVKIRTFLEHRAEARASGRTVVIEDRGPLALLFLNNNFHVVHHMHPHVAWYDLPALYAGNKAHYLTRNGGYRYRSYVEIFRKHFLRPKDPVAHPLWRPRS